MGPSAGNGKCHWEMKNGPLFKFRKGKVSLSKIREKEVYLGNMRGRKDFLGKLRKENVPLGKIRAGKVSLKSGKENALLVTFNSLLKVCAHHWN